jgi:hypothetical protein
MEAADPQIALADHEHDHSAADVDELALGVEEIHEMRLSIRTKQGYASSLNVLCTWLRTAHPEMLDDDGKRLMMMANQTLICSHWTSSNDFL